MGRGFPELKGCPFQTSPDPERFYPSEVHARVLAGVVRAIRDRVGLVLVLGAIGRGKTMICRLVQRDHADEFVMGYVGNPFLGPRELGMEILREFGGRPGKGEVREVVRALGDRLRELESEGRTAVLFIDEAHLLSPDVLDFLLVLTNVQAQGRHLLQVVLSGQPEFQETLARPRFASLNQRLGNRFVLTDLSLAETGRYIGHRLGLAGARGVEFFTPGAVRAVWRASRGTPRLINQICEHSLRQATRDGILPVRPAQVRALLADKTFSGVLGAIPRRSKAPWLVAGLAAMAVFLAVVSLEGPEVPGPDHEEPLTSESKSDSIVPTGEASSDAVEETIPEKETLAGSDLDARLDRVLAILELEALARQSAGTQSPPGLDQVEGTFPAESESAAVLEDNARTESAGEGPGGGDRESGAQTVVHLEPGGESEPAAAVAEPGMPRAQVRVDAIVWHAEPEGRLAVIDQNIVRQGDRIDEWIVETILTDRILLSRGGEIFEARKDGPASP
ncbi:MAG: hypothetical protein EOM25_05220 [Deltaproteobacteria bacterium]|nr:hypothetical protein [Deltaproteobacteria bacterium]